MVFRIGKGARSAAFSASNGPQSVSSSASHALTIQLKLLELASSLFRSSERFEQALLANVFFGHRLHEFEVYGETASVEEALALEELRREDAVRLFMWPHASVPRTDFPELYAEQKKRIANMVLLLRSGASIDQELHKRADFLRALRRSKTKYYQFVGKDIANYIEKRRQQLTHVMRSTHCMNGNYGRIHASTFFDLVNRFVPEFFNNKQDLQRASKFNASPIVFEKIHPRIAISLEVEDLFITGDNAVNSFKFALKVHTAIDTHKQKSQNTFIFTKIEYNKLVPFFQYSFFSDSCDLVIALKANFLLLALVWKELKILLTNDGVY